MKYPGSYSDPEPPSLVILKGFPFHRIIVFSSNGSARRLIVSSVPLTKSKRREPSTLQSTSSVGHRMNASAVCDATTSDFSSNACEKMPWAIASHRGDLSALPSQPLRPTTPSDRAMLYDLRRLFFMNGSDLATTSGSCAIRKLNKGTILRRFSSSASQGTPTRSTPRTRARRR